MSNATPLSVNCLPYELLLKIIEQVPFDLSTFEAIARTGPRFRQIMTRYTVSISEEIAHSQYQTIYRIYPPPSGAQTRLNSRFQGLAMLEHRSSTINRILDLIAQGPLDRLASAENHALWMGWLETGFHLFYRLQDHKTRVEKIAYIRSLPLLAVALIYVTLDLAIRTARALGTCILHPDHSLETDEERMEFCLCFEECTLQHGPGFLYQILSPLYRTHCHHCDAKDDAHTILMTEYEVMEARQFPGPNGEQPQATLISCLKKAISGRSGCRLQKVYETAWRVVQDEEVLKPGSSILGLAFA